MSRKENEQKDAVLSQTERLRRYAHLIEAQTGKAIAPARLDGYVNLINRYGTEKDVTEHYQYQSEPTVPDETLTEFYEGNGLFAKIIDAPAEEAVKHGFALDGVKDKELIDFYEEALDELDWEETAINAIRWARLFGGSIAVMLINDGRGIDEPLDWKNIQSIDDIRVYDRSVIQSDYTTMFAYSPDDPFRTRGSRLGMPEYYHIYSKYGSFIVHESRCLVFQNGVLPENCSNSIYELWGMPEYVRIKRAIRDSELAHSSGPKMLEKSVQAVYKMRDLAAELATEEGESRVLRRLQVIDMARGLLNSIAIDSENEDYDFKTFQFSGVAEIIDTTCNQLSALTSIPQTILFGRSPAGMNSTGESDMENWYNFVGRIQKRMLKSNLRYLLSVIFQAGVSTGEVKEVPKIKPTFNPLWSLSELEQAQLEQTRAATQQTKASTAQIYVSMQAIDPSEVRRKLAESDEFDVENMLDDIDDDDIEAFIDGLGDETPGTTSSEGEGNSPIAAPAATKLPQDMTDEERVQKEIARDGDDAPTGKIGSVGAIVVSEGKVLCGQRHNTSGYGLLCGPGGHIDEGETPKQAAFREIEEEFGITPTELIPLGLGPVEIDTGLQPMLYLCTSFTGKPKSVDLEIVNPAFRTLEEIEECGSGLLFKPFKDGIDVMLHRLSHLDESIDWVFSEQLGAYVPKADETVNDGGPGSGNFGHAGVIGQIGGSAASFDSDKVEVQETGDKLPKERKDELLTLAGACQISPTKQDTVRIRSYDGRHKVLISTDDCEIAIMAKDDKKEILLDDLHIKKTGTGKGTKVLSEIVTNGKQQGFEKITCIAGGMAEDAHMNGYYTWARLGFDAELPQPAKEKAAQSGFDVDRVSELMSSDKGRKYWKENGYCLEMEFDLEDGSHSMNTLTNYVSSRKDSGETSTFSFISENPIDLSAKTSIMKPKEIIEDGAPEGNDNAKGPHKRSKLSKKDQDRYKKRIVGKKTSDGVEVKRFSEPHAFDRIAQRNISMKKIEDMLASDKVSPDKTYPDSRKCYDIEGMRLVLDVTDGTIVTVEKRRQNK